MLRRFTLGTSWRDEFFDLWGRDADTTIRDDDIGNASSLVKLLKRTYLKGGNRELSFSKPHWRPSLVARSDAELYDLENPRWAKRTHVFMKADNDRMHYIGFINVRALKVLIDRVSKDQKKLLLKTPLGPSHLICGAHLTPPRHLQKAGYVFPVLRDMGIYHNELSGWQASLFASPLPSWGGVCSQACVHMAMHPMVKHGSPLLGISDITLTAFPRGRFSDPTRDEEIKGFSSEGLRDVFRSKHIGLNAFWERVSFCTPDVSADIRSLNQAASRITHYLSQGFPVILMVKAARLVGANPGPYPKQLQALFNNWSEAQKDCMEQNLHAILIVGFRSPSQDKALYEMVYHDPLSAPYIPIRVDRLAEAAADSYTEDKKPLGFEFVVPVPGHIGTPLSCDLKTRKEKTETVIEIETQGVIYWSKSCRKQVCDYVQRTIHTKPTSTRGFFPLVCAAEDGKYFLVNRTISLIDTFH